MPVKTIDIQRRIYASISNFQKVYPDILASGQLDFYLDAALIEHSRLLIEYGIDGPHYRVEDLAATAQDVLPIPSDYKDGFSEIMTVEHPIGRIPPHYICGIGSYGFRRRPRRPPAMIHRTPTGLIIHALGMPSGGLARVTYTGVLLNTEVPDSDSPSVVALAASIASESIAQEYNDRVDPSAGADFSDTTTQAENWRAGAARLRKSYMDHMDRRKPRSGSVSVVRT